MIRGFFGKILAGGILVFIFDFVIGSGLRYLYFHRAYGTRENLIYIIQDMKDPIVIFGSSRARHHYVPSLFQSAFGESCFNAGLDGAFIEYHESLLESILNRYVPDIVILDFNTRALEKSPSRRQAVSRLLPFYADHPELRSMILSCGPLEGVKMISRIYPFNSEVLQLAIPYLVSRSRLPNYPDGYIPLSASGASQFAPEEELDQPFLDDGATATFDRFISRAKAKGISLYVIVSPSLRKHQGLTTSEAYAQSVCQNKGVPFWDISELESILRHQEYFQDRTHLNDRGSREFSRIVIERIKRFRGDGGRRPS